MKTKQILMILVMIMALFVISSQTLAAPLTLETKGTPPGMVKTPGAMATQKASDKAAGTISKTKGKHENYKGTITAFDAGGITLALNDGTPITILLTAETRIHIPTAKDAAADKLAIGMTAMVQAIRGQDGSLSAKSVVLIPGKPAKTHRVGIVTAYAAGSSITIQAKDEQLYTFSLTNEVKILPAERSDLLAAGARVTIIAPRDVSTQIPAAVGIVIHPPVVEE